MKGRAGDETRTRDIFLGKEVLYQLSYTREADREYEKPGPACQSPSSRPFHETEKHAFGVPFAIMSFSPVFPDPVFSLTLVCPCLTYFKGNQKIVETVQCTVGQAGIAVQEAEFTDIKV